MGTLCSNSSPKGGLGGWVPYVYTKKRLITSAAVFFFNFWQESACHFEFNQFFVYCICRKPRIQAPNSSILRNYRTTNHPKLKFKAPNEKSKILHIFGLFGNGCGAWPLSAKVR